MPSMATIQKTASPAFGKVAVFNYSGVPHVAVVLSQGYGTFRVRESNYGGDFVSEREVSFSDASLLGFIQ